LSSLTRAEKSERECFRQGPTANRPAAASAASQRRSPSARALLIMIFEVAPRAARIPSGTIWRLTFGGGRCHVVARGGTATFGLLPGPPPAGRRTGGGVELRVRLSSIAAPDRACASPSRFRACETERPGTAHTSTLDRQHQWDIRDECLARSGGLLRSCRARRCTPAVASPRSVHVHLDGWRDARPRGRSGQAGLSYRR